jgi:hypothetical protein
VLDQFKPGPEAATALAFVATLIKDYGAVDESVLLYHATVMMDPTNSYVLNWIHTLELNVRYDECLERTRAFLAAHPDRSVGGVSCSDVSLILDHLGDLTMDHGAWGSDAERGEAVGMGKGKGQGKGRGTGKGFKEGTAGASLSIDPVRAAHFACTPVAGGASSSPSSPSSSSLPHVMVPAYEGWRVRWVPGDDSYAVVDIPDEAQRSGGGGGGEGGGRGGGDRLGGEGGGKGGRGVDDGGKRGAVRVKAARPLLRASLSGGGAKEGGEAEGCAYTKDELDLLALLFAVTKIVFNMGIVQLVPPLIRLIEPVRRGQNIHATLSRNEHAYYCCIAQALAESPAPLRLPSAGEGKNEGGAEVGEIGEKGMERGGGGIDSPSTPPPPAMLTICGDSHSQSPAWQTVLVGGVPHVLRPALVTGLKAWHLRDGSDFYPKINFWKVVEAIPRGSKVVMCFCEIDCREGLLLAYEKDR